MRRLGRSTTDILIAHSSFFPDGLVSFRNGTFVEFNGKPVSSVKTAFKSAVRLAGLDSGVSPHTLRHTAATWLMQRGADPWQAAGYLGMSLEVLLNTYGHHHPDYLSDAVEKIVQRNPTGERKRDVSGAITGAVIKLPTGKRS